MQVVSVEAVLAAMSEWDRRVTRLDGDALGGFVHDLARVRVALDALWVKAVGIADGKAIASARGFRRTADWLASVTGERRGIVCRDLELAAALDEAPLVADAMADGLSKAKAAELVGASRLPDEVQAQLIREAVSLGPEQVANHVRAACLNHGAHDREPKVALSITRHGNHVKVDATLDLIDGEALEVALDTIAHQAPRDVPYCRRRATALGVLARFFLDHEDDPPTTRIGRPHLFVHIPASTLGGEGGSATLGSGAVIDGALARQLACDASVTRVITGPRSEPLDVGRTTRNPPAGLAKAVYARDRHCRYVDCHAPPWLCEIHHRVPWTSGGHTRLDNLGLLCWWHHHQLHQRGPQLLRQLPDGRWTM